MILGAFVTGCMPFVGELLSTTQGLGSNLTGSLDAAGMLSTHPGNIINSQQLMLSTAIEDAEEAEDVRGQMDVLVTSFKSVLSSARQAGLR